MDVAKSLMSLPLKTEKTRKLGCVWDKCVRCHSLLISSDCVHTQIDSHPKGENDQTDPSIVNYNDDLFFCYG